MSQVLPRVSNINKLLGLNWVDSIREMLLSPLLGQERFPMSLVVKVIFHQCGVAVFLSVRPDIVFSDHATDFSQLTGGVSRLVVHVQTCGNSESAALPLLFRLIEEDCFSLDSIPDLDMVVLNIPSENVSGVPFRNGFTQNDVTLDFTTIQLLVDPVEIVAQENSMLLIVTVS